MVPAYIPPACNRSVYRPASYKAEPRWRRFVTIRVFGILLRGYAMAYTVAVSHYCERIVAI